MSGSLLRKLAPRYVREYMKGIQTRIERLEALEGRLASCESAITALETTVDCIMGSPRYRSSDDAGFNGQMGRKRLFLEIVGAFDFATIVETGSWIGNTTGYMAEASGLPVVSAEVSERYHRVAKMRLEGMAAISLHHSDSREFLTRLANDPDVTSRPTFFYLDAHWYSDLPLADEIDIVATSWKELVIMIDDFQVPGDAGYGFDDFGTGRALVPQYIARSLQHHRLTSWFPTLPSSSETGAKRGCVVLARDGHASNVLGGMPSLVKG